MENPEEILHSLEEFAKLKPKDIPRELEEYLCFVAKTGDPVYQWSVIKCLFREKLINVITEFYESCPSVDIPPCPNVDLFNYDMMKSFILEKLDTFVAAPFTVQRICELLTTPRKEYNRIDKYMRALEKNILVVSTTEPGNHRTPENGDGFVNGIETEHMQDGNNDINIEEMDDTPAWPTKSAQDTVPFQSTSKNDMVIDPFNTETAVDTEPNNSNLETVITCCPSEEQPYVSIEPVTTESVRDESPAPEADVSVTITAIPAAVQKRRDSIEPPSEQTIIETPTEEEQIVEPAVIIEEKQKEESLPSDKSDEEENTKEEQKDDEEPLLIPESVENTNEKAEILDEDTIKPETLELEETSKPEITEELADEVVLPEIAPEEIKPEEETKETPPAEETKIVDEPTKVVEEEIETKTADEEIKEVAHEGGDVVNKEEELAPTEPELPQPTVPSAEEPKDESPMEVDGETSTDTAETPAVQVEQK